MATVKYWEQEIKNLGLDHKAEIILGLKALEAWGFFKREFEWTRIFEIGRMIERDINEIRR